MEYTRRVLLFLSGGEKFTLKSSSGSCDLSANYQTLGDGAYFQLVMKFVMRHGPISRQISKQHRGIVSEPTQPAEHVFCVRRVVEGQLEIQPGSSHCGAGIGILEGKKRKRPGTIDPMNNF